MRITLDSDIKLILNQAKEYLEFCSVPDAAMEAELILSNVLGCKRIELYLEEHSLDEYTMAKFEQLLYLRGTRYPLQYIIGSVNFMGFDFNVRPGVFIPRPETELLVEKTLDTLYAIRYTLYEPRILDLCTGSGNIAVSLARFLKTAKIIASDISDEAIKVAQENIMLHDCECIKLVKSDLFENLDEKFDIIVSNPPYVSRADFEKLMPEVLYEPKSALYGGIDGFDIYKKIFKRLDEFLKESGYLIMEIGYKQAASIKNLLDLKKFLIQEILKDYNGIDRVIVIRGRNG